MPIPAELIAELGTPAAVIVLGLTVYFLETKRNKTGVKVEKDTTSDIKLWMIENIKDPILKAIRDE